MVASEELFPSTSASEQCLMVRDVLTEQGQPEDGTDDEAPSQAETFVIMRPQSEWKTGRTSEQVVTAMRALLERRPGIEFNFSQPIKDRVEESISGIRGQVVVKIYGEDLGLLQRELLKVKAVLRATRGSRDVDIYRAGSAQHLVAASSRRRRTASVRPSACPRGTG